MLYKLLFCILAILPAEASPIRFSGWWTADGNPTSAITHMALVGDNGFWASVRDYDNSDPYWLAANGCCHFWGFGYITYEGHTYDTLQFDIIGGLLYTITLNGRGLPSFVSFEAYTDHLIQYGSFTRAWADGMLVFQSAAYPLPSPEPSTAIPAALSLVGGCFTIWRLRRSATAS